MKICKKTVLFTLALAIFVSFFSLAKINVYSANTYEILSKKAEAKIIKVQFSDGSTWKP